MNEQEMKEYVEVSDMKTKLGERVKEHLAELEKELSKKLSEMVWTACNDYVEYAEYEPLENWKDRERSDLVGAKYMIQKDSFWGKQMREKLFEEHKDEILPMIKNEAMEALIKEVAELKDRLNFEIGLNRNRY